MAFAMELCTDKAKWDAFVAASPQNSIFCQTVFLDAMGDEYELYLVSEGAALQLGAIVIKKGGQPALSPCGPTMYQGVLYSKELAESPSHRRIKSALEAAEFLFARLSEIH